VPDDPVAQLLRGATTTDDVRHVAWNAYYGAQDETDLASKIQGLNLPTAVKAKLWDLKHAEQPPETAAPPQEQERQPDAVSPEGQPIFRGENAPIEPNTLGTLAAHAVPYFNPVQVAKGLYGLLPLPKAVGGSGYDNPLNPLHMSDQQQALRQSADADYKRGHKALAAAKIMAAEVPLLGPMVAPLAEHLDRGEYMATLGELVGMGGSAYLFPKIARGATSLTNKMLPSIPATAPLDPAVGGAMNLMRQEGVPVTAGPATGHPYVAGAQEFLENTLGGSIRARQTATATREAMAKLSTKLSDQVAQGAMTPQAAGEALQQAAEDLMQKHHAEANTHYDRMRQLANDPANVVQVPVPGSGQPASVHAGTGVVTPATPPTTQPMALPVDMQATQQLAAPIRDQLLAASKGALLTGDRAQALQTLNRLLDTMGRYVSLDDAGEIRTALMDLGRPDRPVGGLIAESRTAGEGIAASVAASVEDAIQQTMQNAPAHSQAIQDAMQAGRDATKRKIVARDIRDIMRDEPVGAMEQATRPADRGLNYLKELQAIVPAAMPKLGRAVLDNLMDAKSTGELSWQSRLTKWKALGPETKNLLFGPTAPDLDKMFLAGQKLEETINKSKSALVGIKAFELASGGAMALKALTNPSYALLGLAEVLTTYGGTALLHNPAVVDALTNGMQLSLRPGPVAATAQRAALANVVAQGMKLTQDPSLSDEQRQAIVTALRNTTAAGATPQETQ